MGRKAEEAQGGKVLLVADSDNPGMVREIVLMPDGTRKAGEPMTIEDAILKYHGPGALHP